MCCGSSKQTTVQSSSQPSEFIRPYLQYGAQEAQNQYQAPGPGYYPNSTVVPFSPQSEQALRLTENRALAGSPLTGAAQNQLMQTINGNFLNAQNPYFDQAYQSAARPVVDTVTGQFARSGRLGSGAYADVLSRNLAELSGNMAYQNYAAERGRQLSATALAPSLAQADYGDYQQLANVGAARESQAQAQLQDQVNRYNYEQNLPGQKLARYMGLISGGTFGTDTTSSQPVYSNNAANFLGGGLALAGLGKSFGLF